MNSTPSNAVLPGTSGIETTVLLVDDDHSMLRLHQIMLEKFLAPARVTAVDNALQAMLHLEGEVPDLVIVDLNMPGIDGFSLLKLLETEACHAAVAKVILSGMNSRDVAQRGGLPRDAVIMQKPLDNRKMRKIQAHLVTFKEVRENTAIESRHGELNDTSLVAARPAQLVKKKILVVDDNQDVRRLLSITLNPYFEVFEAADGESGLFALYQHRPHLVLLDIMLPGELNGLQVLEMIRADSAYRTTLVALITARGQRSDYLAGQAYGADAYFVKPVSPQQLLDWCQNKCKP